jgi:hypothetical protein
MANGISDSRFYMWRAVVAMVHADGVVTPHELSFINDHVRAINLSSVQTKTIGEDLQTPQDVYDMFARIYENQDKRDFFALARALSWCDGDFATQEQHIIECLEAIHVDGKTRDLLKESREIMNEIELSQNQWTFKTERSQNLFGFLNKRRVVNS